MSFDRKKHDAERYQNYRGEFLLKAKRRYKEKKDEILIYHRKYYQNNRNRVRTQQEEHRDELRSWISNIKRSVGCKDCDESRPVALAFHHKDPAMKVENVSRMVGCGCPKEKIMEEIKKCFVQCHNCHAVIHARAA